MVKDLKAPEEDEVLKNLLLLMWVETGRVRLDNHMNVNPDSDEVWDSVNALPRRLWDAWKDELTRKGFTRNKFLRLMRYLHDDMLLWAYDRIPWGEFIERTVMAIEGPTGKEILEGSADF